MPPLHKRVSPSTILEISLYLKSLALDHQSGTINHWFSFNWDQSRPLNHRSGPLGAMDRAYADEVSFKMKMNSCDTKQPTNIQSYFTSTTSSIDIVLKTTKTKKSKTCAPSSTSRLSSSQLFQAVLMLHAAHGSATSMDGILFHGDNTLSWSYSMGLMGKFPPIACTFPWIGG